MKILLKSFTNPSKFYEVDKQAQTCNCPAFTANRHCKHLDALGCYKMRKATLSAKPSFSQALSALVKSIRIRDIEEAAHWLNYSWSFNGRLPGAQFRTVRRLLIGSAEDGHSIAVMEKMAENFPALLNKHVEFERVIAELLRICKVPNWWHPDTGGHDYIYFGMLAMRKTFYNETTHTLEDCLHGLECAIKEQDKVTALYWTILAHETEKNAGLVLAQKLHTCAINCNCTPAIRLMKNIYLAHSKSLSTDSNFTCQAAWLLSGGVSPVIDQIEPVTLGEVRRLIERVNANKPYPPPEWCCDGVHCAGNDIRYAGMWDRMYAVCNQFSHHQRIQPNDEWLEEQFYSMDGLSIHTQPQTSLHASNLPASNPTTQESENDA
jgi:hypothetical protein